MLRIVCQKQAILPHNDSYYRSTRQT